jgi:Zn-dependent protease
MPSIPVFVYAVAEAIAIIAANLFLAIIIHETGHMIAGLCSGYRVDFVRFGPIQINPPFRVSRAPKFGVYLPGAASLLPRRKDGVHGRAIVFVLGGPLANLISAGCVLLLLRPLPGFAIWFGGLSLLLGLVNLIPFVVSGAASDGNRILMICRRTPRGERWLAIMQLYSALWDGILPENLDPEMLDRATAVADRLVDTVAGHLIAYRAAFHLHRDAEAARLLETALQYYPYTWRPWRQELMVHAAVFQAIRGGRVDLAEQWLKDLPQKLQISGLREQAESAILEGRKEPEAALAKLGQRRNGDFGNAPRIRTRYAAQIGCEMAK